MAKGLNQMCFTRTGRAHTSQKAASTTSLNDECGVCSARKCGARGDADAEGSEAEAGAPVCMWRHLTSALHLLAKPALRGTPHACIPEPGKVAENGRQLLPSSTPGAWVRRGPH